MCTIAAVGIISIGTQIAGNVMQMSAKEGARDANARYYKNLATTNEEQADKILDAAEIQQKYLITSAAKESKRRREDFKKNIGTQKVVLASNGIGGGSATAMDVALDSLNSSAEDEDLIRYNANSNAREIFRGSRFQADQLKSQAKHYRTAAANEISGKDTDRMAGFLNIGSNLAGSIFQYNNLIGKA